NGRFDPPGRSRPDPGELQGGFDVLELMGDREVVRVTAKQPSEDVLAGAPDPQTHLAERLLVGLVVGQTLAAIPRFHRRVEVVGKMLGDLSDAVSPEASEAYCVVDAYPRLEQHPEAPQRFQILLTRQLVGRRS